MAILQLDPPLPLVTPKGKGLAHVLLDYGPEHSLIWVVFINEGLHAAEIWAYGNEQVRADQNVTLGRFTDSSNAVRENDT